MQQNSKTNPLVSVIVPTKNSGAYLDLCLDSISKQTYTDIELIVVDNNSTDDTKAISAKYTNRVYNYGPERSAQRNYGAKTAQGEYLLIIDSDMVLTDAVIAACVEEISSSSEFKAIVIPEQSFGEGFWAKCKQLERSFYIGIDWMEAARFFSRSAFEEFGGYDETNTGTEDYDLPARVIEKYGQGSLGRIDNLINHNEQKLSLYKTCQKKFYYAQRLDSYKANQANRENFSRQSSVFARYTLFFSHPGRLFKNPITGLGMLFMKTSEFMAGGTGYLISTLRGKKNASR